MKEDLFFNYSLLDWIDIQKEAFNNSWNVEGDQNNKLFKLNFFCNKSG